MKTKSLLVALLASSALAVAVEPQKNQPPASPKTDNAQPVAEQRELTVPELEAALKKARSELTEMRVRYQDKHPKVTQQLRTIASLEMELAKRK